MSFDVISFGLCWWAHTCVEVASQTEIPSHRSIGTSWGLALLSVWADCQNLSRLELARVSTDGVGSLFCSIYIKVFVKHMRTFEHVLPLTTQVYFMCVLNVRISLRDHASDFSVEPIPWLWIFDRVFDDLPGNVTASVVWGCGLA